MSMLYTVSDEQLTTEPVLSVAVGTELQVTQLSNLLFVQSLVSAG